MYCVHSMLKKGKTMREYCTYILIPAPDHPNKLLDLHETYYLTFIKLGL